MNTSEYLEVVTEQNIPNGESFPFSHIHEYGLWHRVANIFLYQENHGDIQFLCHKKAKSETPQRSLDPAIGGHVSLGETPVMAILRETKEEIGIDLSLSDIKYGGCLKIQDFEYEKKFNYYFFCPITDTLAGAVRLQKEEIAHIFWQTGNQIYKEMTEGDKGWVGRPDRFQKIIQIFKNSKTIPPSGIISDTYDDSNRN